MHRNAGAVALILALLSAPALAESRIEQIVVLPVVVTEGIDASKGPLLDDMLLTELGKRCPEQIKILGAKDVANLLGHEEQKQLLGCEDDSCLIEIGNAMGASHLFSTTAGRIGDQLVVSGTLLDVRTASALHRETLYPEGSEEAIIVAMSDLSERVSTSESWRQGTAWTRAGIDPLLWGGVGAAGAGALAAGGFGIATYLINENMAPREVGYKDRAYAGLATIIGTVVGGLALATGAAMVALSQYGEQE